MECRETTNSKLQTSRLRLKAKWQVLTTPNFCVFHSFSSLSETCLDAIAEPENVPCGTILLLEVYFRLQSENGTLDR